METNELLTSLARLETTLQEVESAKNQVKHTVDAYKVLQKQIKEYTQSLDSIKTSIQGILSDINSQRASLGQEAMSITAALEAKCNQLLETLKTDLAAANETFAKEGKIITDSFKKSTDDELANLKTTVQSLKECTTSLQALNESIKDTLTQINQTRQEVAELKQALMDSQGSQDTVLNHIQDSINALFQKDEEAFSDLSKSLESSKEEQIALMNGIKESLESLTKNQEDAFSGVSQSIESVRKEQENSYLKIESHLKSETEIFVASLFKENRILRILSIVNIVLLVGIAVLFIIK